MKTIAATIRIDRSRRTCTRTALDGPHGASGYEADLGRLKAILEAPPAKGP